MDSNHDQIAPLPHVLIITGAEMKIQLDSIQWNEIQSKYYVEIMAVDSSIAAFITLNEVRQILNQSNADTYSFFLIPGLIPWDTTKLNHPLQARVKKGTNNFAQLPLLLEHLDLNSLSTQKSADYFLKEFQSQEFNKILNLQKKNIEDTIPSHGFYLSESSDFIFSPFLPIKIIAEIVDFPKLELTELKARIQYYIDSGADIVDLGCIANESHVDYIKQILPELTSECDIPFSIDSFDSNEILAAVENGAQMVLSANFDNYSSLLSLPKHIPIVLIPISFKNHDIPRNPKETIAGLMQLGQIFSEQGFVNLFMDPITHVPINPGFTQSIETLRMLKEGLEALPTHDEEGNVLSRPQLFMGVGNITELIDADSTGINALLSLIAAELDVSAILTTEASFKTRFTISELKSATELAFLAKYQNAPPTDLGKDVFRVKTKIKTATFRPKGEPIHIVDDPIALAIMDSNGYFKIALDYIKNLICITHYSNNVPEPTQTFMGSDAEVLYKRILAENLISRLDHAAYVGKELQKAELALKFGMKFQQD